MADINYSVTVKVDKDFLSNTINASGVTAAMAVSGLKSDTYLLSSTPVSLSTANLTSVGLAFLRNLGTATVATCQVSVVSGGTSIGFCAPRPGETAVLRLAAGTVYQATGAAGTRLRVDITEG